MGTDFNRAVLTACDAQTVESKQRHMVCVLHEGKTVLLKSLADLIERDLMNRESRLLERI